MMRPVRRDPSVPVRSTTVQRRRSVSSVETSAMYSRPGTVLAPRATHRSRSHPSWLAPAQQSSSFPHAPLILAWVRRDSFVVEEGVLQRLGRRDASLRVQHEAVFQQVSEPV